MQTNFTEEQLKIKDNKSSEKIFKKCVHCGMCNATCPTFNLLGDELDGPRGRIYLIQDMLENEKKPTANVVKHIDRCLSCYGCMTTCPAEVNYMHLIDHGRKYIEKNYERPFFDRIIRDFLSTVLPNTKLFKLLSILVKIGKPFKFLFPSKIKDMMNLMPTFFPKKTLKEEDVSRQCFCICDKVRAKYKPKEFLDKPPIEIHNIITPLTSECIKERGQIWHDDTTEEK